MKLKSVRTLLATALLATTMGANAIGWPANYEGVMLQGFYWDSYKNNGNYGNTKWTTLTSQADELSEYFSLIWIPNAAKPATRPSNGYDPVYWFTNYSSSFGNESDLRAMVAAFKEKGTGIIGDVVLNHRSGTSNWTNFPKEEWNGETFQLDARHICKDDEVANATGQDKPTGNYDTGEKFDGARDLDHTNSTVQYHCKKYCEFLIKDLGYAGFRLDMTKGYGGQYTKIYNQHAKPRFSVGEYFDGSYDALAAWIEATGKESAAFDFAFKYALNNAFNANDMSQLSWKANGSIDQPAGLIHFGYQQLAVTFIDNHDTYRDHNKFGGDVLAANAFMLSSPGTPCVYYQHWVDHKAEIKKMIAARNSVGVTNTSTVNVLQCRKDCYMAEIIGKRGKLVVRIGSAGDTPAGYSSSQIACKGTKYCIWTTNQGGNNGGGTQPGDVTTPGDYPSTLYLIGNVNGQNWSTTSAPAADSAKDGVYTWNSVSFEDAGNGSAYFSFITTLGADWDVVNTGDRYGASSKDEPLSGSATIVAYPANVSAMGAEAWMVTPGSYKVTANLNTMTVTLGEGTGGGNQGGGNGGGTVTPNPGSGFNVYFDNSASGWGTPYVHYWGGDASSTWPGQAMNKVSGDIWSYAVPAGTTGLVFNNGNSDQTGDFTAEANHLYDKNGDKGVYSGAGNGGGNQGGGTVTPGDYPAQLYLIGNVNGTGWSTTDAIAPDSASNGIYTWNSVVFDDASMGQGTPAAYFSFVTTLGEDWDVVNEYDRYGSSMADEPLTGSAPIVAYPAQVSAMGATAWLVTPGTYKVVANFQTMTVYIGQPGSDIGGGNQGGGDTPVIPGEYPAQLYLIGNVNGTGWSTTDAIAPDSAANGIYTWNSVVFDDASMGQGTPAAYFSFVTTLGEDWDVVNEYDRYGSSMADEPLTGSAPIVAYPAQVSAMGATAWLVTPGTYKVVANFQTMTVYIGQPGSDIGGGNGGGGDTPVIPGDYPAQLYLIGNVNGTGWSTTDAIAPDSAANGIYTWNSVVFDDASMGQGTPAAYFSFVTTLGEDWDVVNEYDRYGSSMADEPLTDSAPIVAYPAQVSAMGATAWLVTPGTYKVVANFQTMTVSLSDPSGVALVAGENGEAVYFNLNGVRVDNPSKGIYIMVRNGKASKQVVK